MVRLIEVHGNHSREGKPLLIHEDAHQALTGTLPDCRGAQTEVDTMLQIGTPFQTPVTMRGNTDGVGPSHDDSSLWLLNLVEAPEANTVTVKIHQKILPCAQAARQLWVCRTDPKQILKSRFPS